MLEEAAVSRQLVGSPLPPRITLWTTDSLWK